MLSRIIVGLILAIIGVFVISSGDFLFYFWIMIASLIMSLELFWMAFRRFTSPYIWIGVPIILLAITLAYLPSDFTLWLSLPVHLLTLSVVVFCLLELFFKRLFLSEHPLLMMIRIVLLLSFTAPFVYLIRAGHNGFVNTMFACVCIWFTDSCAYFGGRFLGRHRMSEISPKKTWEGAFFGVLGAFGFACVFAWLCHLDVMLYALVSIPISLLSQLGDLHESLTKRFFSVKDSSHILPGHGGIYDRADGYLLVMPVAFYLFNVVLS